MRNLTSVEISAVSGGAKEGSFDIEVVTPTGQKKIYHGSISIEGMSKQETDELCLLIAKKLGGFAGDLGKFTIVTSVTPATSVVGKK